jgi:hypothetical protein
MPGHLEDEAADPVRGTGDEDDVAGPRTVDRSAGLTDEAATRTTPRGTPPSAAGLDDREDLLAAESLGNDGAHALGPAHVAGRRRAAPGASAGAERCAAVRRSCHQASPRRPPGPVVGSGTIVRSAASCEARCMGLLDGLGVLVGEPHGCMVALAGKGHPRAASSGPASPEAYMGDAALGSSNVLAGKEPASPALG